MLTLCIHYTINPLKLAEFEIYARTWPEAAARHGGKVIGYFAPTKIAGRTDTALALIDFPDLTVYERYREWLLADPEIRGERAPGRRGGSDPQRGARLRATGQLIPGQLIPGQLTAGAGARVLRRKNLVWPGG